MAWLLWRLRHAFQSLALSFQQLSKATSGEGGRQGAALSGRHKAEPLGHAGARNRINNHYNREALKFVESADPPADVNTIVSLRRGMGGGF